MRIFFKYFSLFILCIILLIAAGFFIPRKWSAPKQCLQDSLSIVIGTNGYHTSFILPVKNDAFDWTGDFPMDDEITHIEFGWGNQQFYMAKDFSIKTTLRALFPSRTVMHVVYLDNAPEQWFKGSQGKRIYLCKEDYLSLVNYIRSSFELDENKEKIYLGMGLYGPSAFYKGTGDYHALQTCNTWVAQGLRIADVNTPLWGGTAPSIIYHLRNY